MITEIRNENQLKITIDELKKKNENNKYEKDFKILIHFEQFNSNKIQFITNFIFKNYKEKDNYKYIFIIHIKRNFDDINKEEKKNEEKKTEDKTPQDKKSKKKKKKKLREFMLYLILIKI